MLGKKLLDKNGRNLLPVSHEHFVREIVENAIFESDNYSDCQFQRVQLKSLNLKTFYFANCHFKHNYWREVNLSRCRFRNCVFEGSIWKGVVFDGCVFMECEFKSCSLEVEFIDTIGLDTQFSEGCTITGKFTRTMLTNNTPPSKKADQMAKAA